MLRHWERLLRKFPYSKLSKTESTFSCSCCFFSEPALFEQDAADPFELDVVLQLAKEFAAYGLRCSVVKGDEVGSVAIH